MLKSDFIGNSVEKRSCKIPFPAPGTATQQNKIINNVNKKPIKICTSSIISFKIEATQALTGYNNQAT